MVKHIQVVHRRKRTGNSVDAAWERAIGHTERWFPKLIGPSLEIHRDTCQGTCHREFREDEVHAVIHAGIQENDNTFATVDELA